MSTYITLSPYDPQAWRSCEVGVEVGPCGGTPVAMVGYDKMVPVCARHAPAASKEASEAEQRARARCIREEEEDAIPRPGTVVVTATHRVLWRRGKDEEVWLSSHLTHDDAVAAAQRVVKSLAGTACGLTCLSVA